MSILQRFLSLFKFLKKTPIITTDVFFGNLKYYNIKTRYRTCEYWEKYAFYFSPIQANIDIYITAKANIPPTEKHRDLVKEIIQNYDVLKEKWRTILEQLFENSEEVDIKALHLDFEDAFTLTSIYLLCLENPQSDWEAAFTPHSKIDPYHLYTVKMNNWEAQAAVQIDG